MLAGRRYEWDWWAAAGEERRHGEERLALPRKRGWPVGSVCGRGPVSGRASVCASEPGPACRSGYVRRRAASSARTTGVAPQQSGCTGEAPGAGTAAVLGPLR